MHREKRPKPKTRRVLCFLRAVVPPVPRWQIGAPGQMLGGGYGKEGLCCCLSASSRSLCSPDARYPGSPQTSDMAPAPAWAFVYQEGSLRLAPQALGALQVPLLSPRLPLGAVCSASDMPFESISRRGVGWYDAGMGSFAFAEVVVWALLPLNPTPCHFWSHPAPLCLAKLFPKSQAWLFQCS